LPSRKRRTATPAGPPSARPRLEPLEDRSLLSAGSLDPTFGNGGIVTTATSRRGDDWGGTPLVQPDHKIIVTGQPGFGMVRYAENGSLDASFGNGGVVGTTGVSGYAQAGGLQSDGQKLLARAAGT